LPTTVPKERTTSVIASEISSVVDEYNRTVQLQLTLKDRIEALLKEQEEKAALEEKEATAALEIAKRNVLEIKRNSDQIRRGSDQMRQRLAQVHRSGGNWDHLEPGETNEYVNPEGYWTADPPEETYAAMTGSIKGKKRK
jgi:hypothetical protein